MILVISGLAKVRQIIETAKEKGEKVTLFTLFL